MSANPLFLLVSDAVSFAGHPLTGLAATELSEEALGNKNHNRSRFLVWTVSVK